MADTATAVGVNPTTLIDMLRVANSPRFERWKEQVRRTGGCAQPIHLSGHSRTVDTRTGEFFEYSTSSEPGGRLRIACGNRRASRCPSCAWTYAGDTYHLIMAGLVGGKGIPDTVAERPRVFATLTAPSFGPVHN
ncbi:replication initiator, partial [Streptomyces lunaelactis]|nr:replication initiation protein [Streptomyces lunaelactis]